MIDPQIVEKLEIPRTIHALAHQFPVGANWLSRSPLELSCLDVFYKKAKKYLKNNEDWLEIVNFIPWWNAVCKFMEDK